MAGPVRVLLADDHVLFRDGMRALLASRDDVTVVGEAATGEEAVAAARSGAPDVILMDVHMPDLDGLEATRRILAAQPSTGILVVTMFEDDDLVFAAMRAGARGYLLKGAGQERLMHAIDAVAHGEAIFDAAIAQRMLAFFRSARRDLPLAAFPDLTEREAEVLDLIADGRENAAIARRLGIAAKTVRNHVSNVLSKVQASDRTQAALKARAAGFGSEPGTPRE